MYTYNLSGRVGALSIALCDHNEKSASEDAAYEFGSGCQLRGNGCIPRQPLELEYTGGNVKYFLPPTRSRRQILVAYDDWRHRPVLQSKCWSCCPI